MFIEVELLALFDLIGELEFPIIANENNLNR